MHSFLKHTMWYLMLSEKNLIQNMKKSNHTLKFWLLKNSLVIKNDDSGFKIKWQKYLPLPTALALEKFLGHKVLIQDHWYVYASLHCMDPFRLYFTWLLHRFGQLAFSFLLEMLSSFGLSGTLNHFVSPTSPVSSQVFANSYY